MDVAATQAPEGLEVGHLLSRNYYFDILRGHSLDLLYFVN